MALGNREYKLDLSPEAWAKVDVSVWSRFDV